MTAASFTAKLEAIRAQAAEDAAQRTAEASRAQAKREAKAEAEARCRVILAALEGHPAREWEEWISTPELLDALNLPRGKKAYAIIETEMRALGWTPVRAVRRSGHLRYYVKPRGWVRGCKTGCVSGAPALSHPLALRRGGPS
jgi:hypothetical protein